MVDKMRDSKFNIDMDRRLGPWPARVWGLILNFVGNALAIYGAIGYIRDSSRLPCLIIGAAITLVCLLFLAIPSRPIPEDDEAN